MKKDVERIIKNIRGALQADGGDIELIEVTDDGIVKVALRGACSHCPMSTLTLKNFVEKSIIKEVPGVKEVISV
ncbi:MAG: Thioredoxin/NifU-like protein domain protein [Parcubacteria group bacterium GW2011_GWC2_38_7]|nr:MAG: Thioredoxin/NifU-like protein domain protein [Parcubacteria group bacterium GW2011_GWC2_38_7]